jgi:hypothetical protein
MAGDRDRESDYADDEGSEAAWAEEIELRVRQIDSGEVKTIAWGEVRAKLFARLNQES